MSRGGGAAGDAIGGATLARDEERAMRFGAGDEVAEDVEVDADEEGTDVQRDLEEAVEEVC